MERLSHIKELLRRFINFITFIDLPIKRKFLLFSLGVLFWFVTMFGVMSTTISTVNSRADAIVARLVPQDRLAQKIARNLQSLDLDAIELEKTADVRPALKRIELSKARLADVNSFVSTLKVGGKVNDFSRDDDKLIESVNTASVTGDLAGEKYLAEITPLLEKAVRSFAGFADLKMEHLHDSGSSNGKLGGRMAEYRQTLKEALAVTTAFSATTAQAYATNSGVIKSSLTTTSAIIATVLIIASLLLLIFTIWISRSIANPVTSIIDQIHSLGTGDIDLSKKIAINSKDEIGILSHEFNALMESIHGMNIFKKVIEEDDALEDVYSRLGGVFSDFFGIRDYMIYEIANSQNKMRAAHPLLVAERDLPCNPDILDRCDLCKAKKTGHPISSIAFPRVCKQFIGEPGVEHICIPMIVGGSTGGVVQLRFQRDEYQPHEMERLAYRARLYVKESLSVIEAKRLMNTLRESALKDSLTGLYNRRFLQDYTETLVAGALRRGKHIGLIMCDLDFFKQVNDIYGHNTGDAILKETAKIIRDSVRTADLVIRFGGEEFLVVLLDTNRHETVKVAEKIRTNIEAAKLKVSDGILRKTISLGVSEFPDDTQAFWQAIKYADVALYKAKETGRNRVVRFAEEMWSGEQF